MKTTTQPTITQRYTPEELYCQAYNIAWEKRLIELVMPTLGVDEAWEVLEVLSYWLNRGDRITLEVTEQEVQVWMDYMLENDTMWFPI